MYTTKYKASAEAEALRVRTKMKPRQASSVRADLAQFPWDNPIFVAGVIRVVELLIAKVAEESTAFRATKYSGEEVCD